MRERPRRAPAALQLTPAPLRQTRDVPLPIGVIFTLHGAAIPDVRHPDDLARPDRLACANSVDDDNATANYGQLISATRAKRNYVTISPEFYETF
jgi:hypothetical protein